MEFHFFWYGTAQKWLLSDKISVFFGEKSEMWIGYSWKNQLLKSCSLRKVHTQRANRNPSWPWIPCLTLDGGSPGRNCYLMNVRMLLILIIDKTNHSEYRKVFCWDSERNEGYTEENGTVFKN